MSISASTEATLDHITRINDEAEVAFLHAVRRDCAGDPLALLAAYNAYREVGLRPCGKRWNEHTGIGWQAIKSQAAALRRDTPNHEDERSWRGSAPLHHGEPAPPEGRSVVYVLYDATLTPCYVGSTKHFRWRLKDHIKGGKPVHAWTAYPCEDRKEAFKLESTLLRQFKPYLNRRV